MPSEVLLLAGRSGVGKSTVGWEVSEVLQRAHVEHAILEGDFMGQVHPAPAGDPHRSMITERNLAAVWSNFHALGYRRLIYTNTVSILVRDMFRRAMGEDVKIIPVLLTATDVTVRHRLTQRETGSQLEHHLERSASAAAQLDHDAPADTTRVATDDQSVGDVAHAVAAVTCWTPSDRPE